MVELLSTCPTNWGMTPVNSLKFVEEHMIPAYPLGDYKVSEAIKQIKFNVIGKRR
jgi:2-oxoglutarate/2-oxoacid ferredoxin oxidoreductase subunit beta